MEVAMVFACHQHLLSACVRVLARRQREWKTEEERSRDPPKEKCHNKHGSSHLYMHAFSFGFRSYINNNNDGSSNSQTTTLCMCVCMQIYDVRSGEVTLALAQRSKTYYITYIYIQDSPVFFSPCTVHIRTWDRRNVVRSMIVCVEESEHYSLFISFCDICLFNFVDGWAKAEKATSVGRI